MAAKNPLRELPSIDTLLADKRVQEAAERHGREPVLVAARRALEHAREEI
ncbi:MAG: hypothetical protein H0V20_03205, partial [Actinobacteria bacterium]|nr:hypothetical protein [Actinomycetota bacterium]